MIKTLDQWKIKNMNRNKQVGIQVARAVAALSIV
jgi:lipoate-protein ligase B